MSEENFLKVECPFCSIINVMKHCKMNTFNTIVCITLHTDDTTNSAKILQTNIVKKSHKLIFQKDISDAVYHWVRAIRQKRKDNDEEDWSDNDEVLFSENDYDFRMSCLERVELMSGIGYNVKVCAHKK